MANFDFIDMWRKNRANVGHSGFDLSRKQVVDFPCSQINPHLFIPTIPNEHHKINLDGLLRSETLNKAAFVNGTFHTLVFFVPLKQLWHNANDFITQKQDRHSNLYKGSNFAPNFRLTDLLRFIRAIHFGTHPLSTSINNHDIFGYRWSDSAIRMLQLMKYGNYRWIIATTTNESGQVVPAVSDENFAKYLDDLDGHPDGVGGGTIRYLNLWRPLAYQHVFYDYYRNKYYDEVPYFNPHTDDTFGKLRYIDVFNVDDISCDSFANSHLAIPLTGVSDEKLWQACRLMSIFECHYMQYKRDIYTSAMPATQFGAVSSVSFEEIEITNENHPSGATANAQVLGAGYESKPGTLYFGNQNNKTWTIANALNVLTFRKAELLQSWKQNALRAGNMVDDNFRSHYGVAPYYEDDNNVKLLGSFSCHLDINPITSTAATGDSVNGNVGDLAAIGVGSVSGDEINFECKDFGYIIACTAFLPDVYYNGNGIDADNTFVEPFDYPTPEFDNTGLEPLCYGTQNVDRPWNLGTNVGFVPPYAPYKTAVDEVFGEFSDIDPSVWPIGQPLPSELIHDKGSLRAWVCTRSEQFANTDDVGIASNNRTLRSLYIDPAVINPIFEIAYDGTQKTFPFNLALSWHISSIRPLSVLGIPQF